MQAICPEEGRKIWRLRGICLTGCRQKSVQVIVRWLMPGEAEGTDQGAHRILTPLCRSRPVVSNPSRGLNLEVDARAVPRLVHAISAVSGRWGADRAAVRVLGQMASP